MKIYLYLESEIYSFSLASDVMGDYSFDYDLNEENKLINVEARNGQWYLYSTLESNILQNGNLIDSILLESGKFYTIRRRNKDYLIFFNDLALDSIQAYSYGNDVNILIGNVDSTNIQYFCNLLNNMLIKIHYINGSLILENISNSFGIYINNNILNSNNVIINIGDQLNVYGLKIMFLRDMFLINTLSNKIVVKDGVANIHKHVFLTLEAPKKIEIKDRNLYEKDDYFSKAPRIRRLIETKEIKLSPPPRDGNNSELPAILTIGPMLTMGVTSGMTLLTTITKMTSGETSIKDQWPSLFTSGAMLLSMILWPTLTRIYNKKMKKKKSKELIQKYGAYLDEKKKELENERNLQKSILLENLFSVDKCIDIISNKCVNFWDKRIDQSDFLIVRIGHGNELLDVKIGYPEEGFTIEEDELKKQADKMVADFKYIQDVPIGYSLYDNTITAVMGNLNKAFYFVNNIILQLLTFYSYEDLKLVVFTQDKNKKYWEYIKYLNHNFNNEKSFRFFASNADSYRNVAEFLRVEVANREPRARDAEIGTFKPHYLIIIDDYEKVKRFDFIKTLTETDENLGFSVLIIEDRLSKLPSKCNNFITLGMETSGVLKNSYEKQEQIIFKDEIKYNVNMMAIAKILANIPIEFEEGIKTLPDAITFLEMEKVGKVEQLNILNRWNTNDATTSLKAEIGVDEQGELMYLDLHEKYHGPHGLIAGTTGSGKSEFIITYILSMCINYSPDDVAFILIDYKGGGLALAFENKTTGVYLPHLAGTITNLDKAEMDRTLVSIDSEVKRRQQMFNTARDKLGESTIDIYKYQRFFKEGKLEEPIPHLFIICDEFAELKSQQPEFMDNLISVARIGRSLGVHLILATQKPSGVVNDQIWSNTKFRVCLKVQSEADSKEMLKRPEAAAIKQAGRYYLQVGFDEYFALGQSGWCGAKYYPSDAIVKQVDKSINFVNDCGLFIKRIQAGSGPKKVAQGEQLAAVMSSIIEASKRVNKVARRLWLENISDIILVDELEKKYGIASNPYNVVAVLGEYDAPEKQEQGVVKYDYLEDGNTIIYGNDGSEREKLVDTLICSTVKNYGANEVNYYIIDYGSESLVKYSKLSHVGGVVIAGEDEKFNNLFKLLNEEIKKRKKLFADYGGEYVNYVKSGKNELPIYTVIINNYSSVYEAYPNLYDILPELVRDSARYGIVYIITANAINTVSSKISTNFNNIYAFKLKDSSDYSMIFGMRTKTTPREIFGRGLLKTDIVHEFQTASIVADVEEFSDYLIEFIDTINANNTIKAIPIPSLPEFVRIDNVNKENITLNHIPIGIVKSNLDVLYIDYLSNCGNIITSNKIENTNIFVKSLIKIFASLSDNVLMVIDAVKMLMLDSNIYPNYYVNEFEVVVDKINEYVNQLIENKLTNRGVILIYGLSKFVSKVSDTNKISDLFKKIKNYENISIVVVDDHAKIKEFAFDAWFKDTFPINNGVWIGRGIADQNLLKTSSVNREMTKEIKNNMGYAVEDGLLSLVKLIDFITPDGGVDNE